MQKNTVIKAGFFAAGALFGGTAIFLMLDKDNKRYYRDIAEAEIDSVKDTYNLLMKEGKYEDPREALQAHLSRLDELDSYSDLVSDYSGQEEAPEGPVAPPSDQHATSEVVEAPPVKSDIGPDLDLPDHIKIISYEVFGDISEESTQFDKTTLMYYAEDDTLTDERDEIVPDVEAVIGVNTLKHFGHESYDEDTVYVRNYRIDSDFEVLREHGSYSDSLLGVSSLTDEDERDDG